jgi:succinate-semialdehyde dehydrogenase/glutarate-semialdehyde dehydrogenase
MKSYPLYLNGRFVPASETIPVRNPATGETFTRMSICGRDQVRTAIENAHEALAAWRRLPGKTRGEFLSRIADETQRRKDEIARTITLENGKPLAQSHGEAAMTVDHLRWFAEEARRGYGRIIPNQVEGKRHLVIKTPIGVVATIGPWNFPLVLGIRKIAPALAAGCTAILKPASATPVSTALFAECVQATGLPAGVFQFVAGAAAEIGAEFLENPLCRKVSFTGSTEVGRRLITAAAATVKPLSLELGGCAPLLVFEDCNIEQAVEGTILAKFRNAGQSCIAANRIYVQRLVYPRFLDLLAVRVRDLKVGNGLEPGVDIGPLINEQAVANAEHHVQDAVAQGARLLCGGRPVEGLPGSFFAPTVLADVPDSALCFREETFAPIAPVSPFDTEAEAVGRANATPYGLSAYAFTRDLDRSFRLVESLEAGMISINDGLPTATSCPFGGVKQSGWGRELGIEGMEAFLETKHISLGVNA